MTTAATDRPGLLYEERLAASPRAWLWLPVVVVITFLAIAPIIVPVAVVAWLVNIGRYKNADVRIDRDYVWVGHRWAPLVALDLSTLGRASNAWPWRSFNNRYLSANPLWTRDSVGVRGDAGGRKYWLSVGTNRRDELVSTLTRAVNEARERLAAGSVTGADAPGEVASPAPGSLPPPGWHDDPWDPVTRLRWWDGAQWTGYTWPRGPEERS